MATISKQDNKTVLQSLLESGADTQYQCGSGYCGSCRCNLKKGEVEYIDEPMAWLNDGEFLPCISIAKSKTIVVEAAF